MRGRSSPAKRLATELKEWGRVAGLWSASECRYAKSRRPWTDSPMLSFSNADLTAAVELGLLIKSTIFGINVSLGSALGMVCLERQAISIRAVGQTPIQ